MELAPVPATLAQAAPARPAPVADEPAALATARAFEAAFLAEMLKHTGVNAMSEGFGGGAGEDAFASFLTQEYARLLAERGGIGLAERVFEAIATQERGR